MDDVHLTLVEGYRYNGGDVDLSTEDFWTFALDQRYFGPRRVIVRHRLPTRWSTGPRSLSTDRPAGDGPEMLSCFSR